MEIFNKIKGNAGELLKGAEDKLTECKEKMTKKYRYAVKTFPFGVSVTVDMEGWLNSMVKDYPSVQVEGMTATSNIFILVVKYEV